MGGVFLALFLTNVIVIVFAILILTLQNYLTFSQHVKWLRIDLGFHIAISFVIDTDLQLYAVEQQISNVSPIIPITFTMFVALASEIVAAFARYMKFNCNSSERKVERFKLWFMRNNCTGNDNYEQCTQRTSFNQLSY